MLFFVEDVDTINSVEQSVVRRGNLCPAGHEEYEVLLNDIALDDLRAAVEAGAPAGGG